MVTLQDLQRICPTTRSQILARYVNALNDTMREFEINTPEREAMFLAQVCHESGGFNYLEEIASGDAYEGRKDLGNTEPGDGRKFKGHGLIQCTGRHNHQKFAAYKGMTLDDVLEYLKTPKGAAEVSGWFWKTNGCNDVADRGDFLRVTKIVNGGTNGFADRQAYYQRATEVLA